MLYTTVISMLGQLSREEVRSDADAGEGKKGDKEMKQNPCFKATDLTFLIT